MEIKYELLEDDYIKFNLYHLRNSSMYKKQVFIVKYIVNTIGAISMFCIGSFIFNQSMLFWLLFSILFLIIQIKTNDKQNEKREIKQIKKFLKEKDNKFIFGEKTLKIDNDKIYLRSNLSEEIKYKNSIIDIKISDDLILLYDSSVTAEVIPTRYLDKNEIEKLVSILKNDLKKNT